CVGDIALALDLSEDAVGYGLRVLRGRGLVRRDPRGRMAFYALADGVRQGELLDALAQLHGVKRPE
ncbi:MAG: ArsR family transcriptional regulator, partial [Actinomycetota bacterium]|nr:ArsR family transcriptional regulator [Actinomycetota bacterium]